MISISSQKQLVSAMDRAKSILLTAYTLRPGTLLNELQDAAVHGARVTVRLEGRPYGDTSRALIRQNRLAIKALKRAGADAKICDTNSHNGPPLHMKAAVCDGVAYLDDRNWPNQGDSIVRDDFRADVAAIESAVLSGHAARAPEFWTNKRDALWAERRLLESARGAKRVEVESESFGAGSGVYGSLKTLAQSGVPCKLIVARRDLNDQSERALAALSRAGVQVRLSDSDEKMALVDGSRAWLGSANATTPHFDGDQIEWGLRTDSPDVLRHFERRFASTWRMSTPFTLSW